jgi:hypothetical protein
MNIFFGYSVMGLEATVNEFCDGKRNEVRVAKRGEMPEWPAHVCFAGSGSVTPARQAAEIAKLIHIGAQIAEAFDVINLPVASLGKLTVDYDAQTGLKIEMTRDERNALDQARILDELSVLLSTLAAQPIESLLGTLKRRSWMDLRGLPKAEYENLLKKSAPESIAELL